MKQVISKLRPFLLAVWLALPLLQLRGQFDSGSAGNFPGDGVNANGIIDTTNDTEPRIINLPSDGIIDASTVTVAAGTILRFTRNEFNTPVFLLATGDVVIDGIIDVSADRGTQVIGGAGGPGGFDGGTPASSGSEPGDGAGPGGGKSGSNAVSDAEEAGSGSYTTVGLFGNQNASKKGAPYGSPLLIPMIGGSGGGGTTGAPGYGGGGGGGAILIASNTEIRINSGGIIRANGGPLGNSADNAGSGGAIRLIAPKVSGGGRLEAVATNTNFTGSNFFPDGNQAGFGRIRIDTLDKTALALSFDRIGATSIGSNMVVFPNPTPRLDIVAVPTNANIPVGTAAPVAVILPFGSSPNQTITVQAKDFGAIVPIAVVLQPDNGSRVIVEDSIDNSTTNPATKDVAVTLPVNVRTKVFVWTR